VGSWLEIFGFLLDASIEQISAVSADARNYDGQRIRSLSDIWDNNSFPLVAAATSGRPLRIWRARTGLRWMAELGSTRRAWMIDVEPSLARILPAAKDLSVYRDHQGYVQPGTVTLDAAQIAGLEEDYDFSSAQVRSVSMEATSAAGLMARLSVEVQRRYRAGDDADGARDALLRFTFPDVSDFRFDAGDRHGLSVVCGDGGVCVVIGQDGFIGTGSGEVRPDDWTWHRSRAGMAADAVTAPRALRRRRERRVSTKALAGQPYLAARLLHRAMLIIRTVRYPHLAPCVPVHRLALALAGAGSDIVAAGARRGFGDLMRKWIAGGIGADLGKEVPLTDGPVQLRYASYTATHQDWGHPRKAAACLNAAVPHPDSAEPWRLAGMEMTDPAAFGIGWSAFNPHRQLRVRHSTLTIGDDLTIRPW